jgi:hypothetical protein
VLSLLNLLYVPLTSELSFVMRLILDDCTSLFCLPIPGCILDIITIKRMVSGLDSIVFGGGEGGVVVAKQGNMKIEMEAVVCRMTVVNARGGLNRGCLGK